MAKSKGRQTDRRQRSNRVTRVDIAAGAREQILADHRDYLAGQKYLREHGPKEYAKKYMSGRRQTHQVVVVEPAAATLARQTGADPDEIVRILYSPSDLNFLFVSLQTEETWETLERAARVWERISRILEKANWPFDRIPLPMGFYTPSPLGSISHPLSKQYFEKLSVRHDRDKIAKELKTLRANRRQLGIDKGPHSQSFQRVKVLRTKGRTLWAYLARSAFAKTVANDRNWTPERLSKLTFDQLKGSFSRAERHRLMVETVELINQAFPSIARLTPLRVWGSTPKRAT